jgi:hypothetical protein
MARTVEEWEIALEWAAIAEKRVAEIDDGTAETVPFDLSMENARRAVRDVAARTAERS